MRILSAAILLLFPGALVPAHKQEQREQEKQPEKQQQHATSAQQAKPAPQQAGPPHQAKPAQKAGPVQRPAKSPQPAVRHARISDQKFRASFGSGHTFHVSRSDFNGAARRFQYGGFSWALINPWPVGWLYTDSVYVDFVNEGYFLCAPIHPGVYLSLSMS
jgi:hemolysin activation/secretion protein